MKRFKKTLILIAICIVLALAATLVDLRRAQAQGPPEDVAVRVVNMVNQPFLSRDRQPSRAQFTEGTDRLVVLLP
jgi:hypothetical protein